MATRLREFTLCKKWLPLVPLDNKLYVYNRKLLLEFSIFYAWDAKGRYCVRTPAKKFGKHSTSAIEDFMSEGHMWAVACYTAENSRIVLSGVFSTGCVVANASVLKCEDLYMGVVSERRI